MHHPNRNETPELVDLEYAREKEIAKHPDHGLKYAFVILITLCSLGLVIATCVIVAYFKWFAK